MRKHDSWARLTKSAEYRAYNRALQENFARAFEGDGMAAQRIVSAREAIENRQTETTMQTQLLVPLCAAIVLTLGDAGADSKALGNLLLIVICTTLAARDTRYCRSGVRSYWPFVIALPAFTGASVTAGVALLLTLGVPLVLSLGAAWIFVGVLIGALARH